jgi:hypothetical protein
MDAKFVVGQTVSYRPMGQRPALFKVVQHMPEPGFSTARYRIKNNVEGFERIVVESDLHKVEETLQTRRIGCSGRRSGAIPTLFIRASGGVGYPTRLRCSIFAAGPPRLVRFPVWKCLRGRDAFPRTDGFDYDIDSGQRAVDLALHAVDLGLQEFLHFLEFGYQSLKFVYRT